MKRNLWLRNMLLAVIVSLLVTSCIPKPVKDVLKEYYKLVEFYQKAQKQASNFRLCRDTAMGQIYVQTSLVNSYQMADIEKANVWRKVLAERQQAIDKENQAYLGSNGQLVQPSQLDLAKLADQQALPPNMGSSLGLYINAFVEAPLAQVDSAPVLAAQRTVSEQFNMLNACGRDWNDSVESYNVERRKVSAEVAAAIADKLGVTELPAELPYYAGDYAGSVSQPNLPTPSK